MAGLQNNNHPVNPRRRKRSKMKIFKEAYLPALILGAAIILVLVLVIGTISRTREANREASIAASIAQAEEDARLSAEQESLLARADALAMNYDYQAAIQLLNTFSGDLNKYPLIAQQITAYQSIADNMVAWNLNQVVNLSFQMLMADPEQSFRHSIYGTAFNRNYVTIGEFSLILEQLYENGYVLVNMDQMIATKTADDGSVIYEEKALYLPAGKKPLMLTQTNVNYNYYIVDSDGDLQPDKNGAGFASKLVLDVNGNVTCQRIDRNGNTITGAYDMIPILDAFVAENPDFSYHGAKATIALTGYNGLFGYRTQSGAEKDFGADAYNEDVANATKIAKALKDSGYKLACYTYSNVPYGEYGSYMLADDLNKWIQEALPILGAVDTMVFAQKSDIAAANANYSGDKFKSLQDAGFRYYLGFCNDGGSWAMVSGSYVRHGRILVTGSNMEYHSDWFEDLFDTESVLDYDVRGNIPV